MKTYLAMNALLAVSGVVFYLMRGLFSGKHFGFSAKYWLRLARILLAGSILFAVATPWIPRAALFHPPAKSWGDTRLGYANLSGSTAVPVSVGIAVPSSPSSPFGSSALPFLFYAGLAVGVVRLFRNYRRLVRSLTSLPVLRRYGRVVIATTSDTRVPYSARILAGAYVVIPESILLDRGSFRIALAHELQHHRSRDTVWTYAIECLKIAFFLNPGIYAWGRITEKLQEFAVDEFLVRIRRISTTAYGRCLLEVAKNTLAPGDPLVGTTSMAAGFAGKLLERRIEMLFENQNRPRRPGLALVVLIGTLGILAATAVVERSFAQTRALSLKEAESYAEKANRNPKFPVEMNDLVLGELNHILTDESARESMRQALARLPAHEPMIRSKIEAFELAEELLAVPIVESRYENYYRKSSVGAGLWGFIIPTGKKYGLHIETPGNPESDERLVEHRETLAAMRYFTHLRHDLFKDWRLALLGYNVGENQVHRLMKKYATRDPWVLERSEPSADRYLAKIMSAIILMRNPTLLD